MAYADYLYYRDTYHGSLPEEEFERLSRRASAYLDQVTFGRITSAWAAGEPVKDACCAVADEMFRAENPGTTSRTVGAWSETYVSTESRTPQQRLYDAAVLHLSMTGLLYRGV